MKDLAANTLRRVHTIHLKKFNGTGEGMILPTKVQTGNLLNKKKPRAITFEITETNTDDMTMKLL